MKKQLVLNENDDLFELVQEWKPYFDIAKKNQKKLRLIIKEKNSYLNQLKEAATLESPIERLRKEMKTPLGNRKNDKQDHAQKDGLQWAKNATYHELQTLISSFENNIGETPEGGYLLDTTSISILGGNNLVIYFEDDILPLYLDMDWATTELNEYISYWFSGVKDFWNIIISNGN